MEPFIIAFLSTFVAEMGDKTQLVTLAMACRYCPRQVFLGAMIALAIVTGMGVGLGEILAKLFPVQIIAILSGLLFLFIGLYIYLRKDTEKNVATMGKSPFWQTFGLVFLAEMGDKSQLLSVALTATLSTPLLIFSGAMLGQALNHGIAAFLSVRYLSLLPDKFLKVATLLIFVFFGLLMIYGGWRA